jgi:hypothetical protein
MVLAFVLWWGFSVGQFGVPGGDTLIWDRVGDQVRAGINPYGIVAANPSDTFWYSPPVALVFAFTSLLPPIVQWLAIVALEVAALRYVTGSWRSFGIAGWLPLTAFELVSGNFNLIIVAAIVLAIRGKPAIATIMSFLKMTPILAVNPRSWKRVAMVVAIVVIASLPVLWLWPEWVKVILGSFGQPIGISVPVPFAVRAVGAALLLGLRRPWSRALAAAVAIPAFYYGSLILLLVVLADRRRRRWFGPPESHPGRRARDRRAEGS